MSRLTFVRAVTARWFRLVGVPLGNATADYPDGDDVQAIERWEPPEVWEGIVPETLNAILDAIDTGMPNGRRYSNHGSAKDRAAWHVVQQHCPGKSEALCRGIITQWIEAAVLIEDKYFDPVNRKERLGLRVDGNRRPQY
jgi:hypothetical protein